MKEQEVKKRHAIGEDSNQWENDMKEMKQWADEARKKEAVKSCEPKLSSSKRKPLPKESNRVKQTAAKAPEPKKAASPRTVKSSAAASKKTRPAVKKTVKNKNDAPKKPNYLLWVTIIIIAIPCLILMYIFIGSRESSSTPVEGTRFKNALDPKITEEDLKALESSLKFDNAEAIEINLKSATLRININAKDDLSQKAIKKLITDTYKKVDEKLPVKTYFTNKENGDNVVKMYDLEISAYNYIPEKEEDKKGQIHLSRVKNSSAEKPVDDVLSSPKDKQSAEEILNPDTSNPPTNDNKGKTEGE